VSIGFIALFMLQVSVKSLVSFYFNVVMPGDARENCVYKTITVCKGSCYVVKKIKMFFSESTQKKTGTPAFDVNMFKDVICLQHYTPDRTILVITQNIWVGGEAVNHYSFQTPKIIIKPPIA
jgi:hypothetical protein